MLSLIDFILNIASLLLFLNWRAVRVGAMPRAGVSIVSTLKRAGPPARRWLSFVGLGGLLLVRAGFYWQIGPAMHWDPKIPFGPTTIAFRSDFFGRMFVFSLTGFVVSLVVFFFWLLLLSCLNEQVPDTDPQQKLVRLHLGWLDRLPVFVKLLLPFFVVTVLWLLFNPLLVVPQIASAHRFWQSTLVGLATYLTAQYLLVGFLVLYLLNSYVYLGEFTFWTFVNATAKSILRPLKSLPLRYAKIDFAPLVAIILILVAAEFSRRGLTLFYRRLF